MATVAALKIWRHDLQPYYRVTVKDSDGALVDLSGASIVCTMKSVSAGTLKINRSSTGIVIANQTTNKGEFEYRWQSGDTDTEGNYNIEFEITPSAGGKITLPSPELGPAEVIISADLDGS